MKAAQELVKQQEGGVIWHTQGKSILMVMIAKLAAFTWFINDGYSQIAQMQRIEAVWQKKARRLIYRVVTANPALRSIPAVHTVIKRIPG